MEVTNEPVASAPAKTQVERFVIQPEPVPMKRRRRRKQKLTEIFDADSSSLVQSPTEIRRRRMDDDIVNSLRLQSKKRRRRKRKFKGIPQPHSTSLIQHNTNASVSLKNEAERDTISASIDRVLANIRASFMEPANSTDVNTLPRHQDVAATTLMEQELGGGTSIVMKNSLHENAGEEQGTVDTKRLESMEAEQECFLELDFTLLMSTISECVSCQNCRGSIKIVETSVSEQQTECIVQCDTHCGELCAFPFKVHRDHVF